MEKSWLWNTNKSEKEAREILKDPSNEKFVHYAVLLLSRSNVPADVFDHYIAKETFVRHWSRIKRSMRKNKWNQDRIQFWQEIFRFLSRQMKSEGIKFRPAKAEPPGSLRKEVGGSIKKLRVSKGMTQQELAQRAGIHQQVISKIEKGMANPSLKTLEKIMRHLPGGGGIKIVNPSADQITTSYQGLGKQK